MADPQAAVDAAGATMPEEATPLANPPATLDQIEHDPADRARAALGGRAPEHQPTLAEAAADPDAAAASGVWRRQPPGSGAPVRSARFQTPAELDFEFTPPATQQLGNNNLPLTVGLLLSIIASFLVFFLSLGAAAPGEDPIMPAFWRALGALAVLITLSFAASWFMPTPPDRRQLLDQLDAQDRVQGRYREPERIQAEREVRREYELEPEPEPEPEPELTGSNIDYTADDDDFPEETGLAEGQQDLYDDFDDDEEEDLLASPNRGAV